MNPDLLDYRLEAAIARGEMTDEEARQEWLAAEEEARYELEEEWR